MSHLLSEFGGFLGKTVGSLYMASMVTYKLGLMLC